MKVLITGGAGYIGTTLVPLLLDNKAEVTVFDSLMFGGNGLLPFFNNENFRFVKGDIRDTNALAKEIAKHDVIIHLAALVGFPMCEKNPVEAKQVNLEAVENMVKHISKSQYVLYGSTGSNYGVVKDCICTEETPLNPVSLYGKTKTEAENVIMQSCNATAFRFATAFGLSPRLRLDLLVNDFINKALNQKYLVVYESHFMRTFLHVRDIARSFLYALLNVKMSTNPFTNNVYNVGDDSLNYSKKDICLMIQKYIDYYIHDADFEKDVDVRNYVVSYDKIKKTGFKSTISMEQGIKELVNGLQVISIYNPYSNV